MDQHDKAVITLYKGLLTVDSILNFKSENKVDIINCCNPFIFPLEGRE